MKYRKILLALILILFLISRLFKITEIPASLYWDEASIGYNAHSILKTGKDEWGESFPLHFRAFGEYKLPLYIYTVALFQFILGPSELSVRLPSVLFSLGAIVFIYLIVLKIFKNFKIAFFSAFLLTVTPWIFIFSRTGFEATAGLMFYLLGILFFIHSDKKPLFILTATFFYILAFYSYNSFRFLVPLAIFILAIFMAKKIKFNIGILTICLISIFIFTLSIFPIVANPYLYDQNSRFNTVSVISKSKKTESLINISTNFIKHFDPQFLFLYGDNNPRHNVAGFGEVYLLSAPFLLLGIYRILKERKVYLFPIFFLLIGVLPAAITKESPHSLRAIGMMPFLLIITSIGIFELTRFFKHQTLILLLLGFAYIFSFGLFLNSFFTDYSRSEQKHWQYGYKEIFTKWKDNFGNFDKVIISNRESQPHIFALFYLGYDPDKFRREVDYNFSETKATSLVNGFDKFQFVNIDYRKFPEGKSLIFADPTEKLSETQFNDLILNPDETVAFYVYEFNK